MARVEGTTGNDDLVGTALDDTIFSGRGHDSIHSGSGDDYIESGGVSPQAPDDDDDVIDAGFGNDSIDGGTGNDQARFSVAGSDFNVTKEGDVYTIVSADGTDRVTNVEEFVFSDTILSTDDLDALVGIDRITGNLPGGAATTC